MLGTLNKVAEFVFGDETEVHYSCSATLNGEMFVFGGYNGDKRRQISKVENCSLKRIGTLPMDFADGTCNTYQTENGEWQILLCFGEYDESGCHR